MGKFFFMAMVFVTSVMGQEVDPTQAQRALDGLGASDWGQAYESTPAGPDTTPESTRNVEIDSTQRVETPCTADQQTSLPYKFFLNLLASKKLTLTPNASRGTLSMNTGMMIGNCNSMLNVNFAQPQEGRPYLIQVEIRKPADCTGEVCNYDALMAQGGIATGETKSIAVAPNYYGFIQCLKETGALNDDMSVNPSGIAAVELSRTFTGLSSTDQVWFYSKGPEAAKQGGVWSENKKRENSCRFYEDIAENGYTYYSEEDIRRNRKKSLFKEICNSGDYTQIEQHLPDFAEFAVMKNLLERVRDIYLLGEVKKLHTELKREDYSDLSADKYQKIINDFYNKIIVPKRRKIERLVADINAMSSGPEKKALERELKELTEELESYVKSPYLTSVDYNNMKSFIKKSPLQEEAWRDAALKLFAANNTAYHFSRYNSASRAARGLEVISVNRANDLITSDVAAERSILSDLGKLASDTNYSVAADYRDKAQAVEDARDDYKLSTQEFEREEMSYLYNHCYNPAKYWVNRQKCAQEVMANIRAYRQQDELVYDEMRDEYDSYMEQADYWSKLESQRDEAFGIQRSRDGQTSTRRVGSSAVDARSMRNPNYSQNYQDFYQRMMQMNGGAQSQGQMGGYNSFGQQSMGQFNFQSGYNRAPASGYWPTRPTAGNYNHAYWGQPMYSGGMMNPAMHFQMGSSTMYGPYQFR